MSIDDLEKLYAALDSKLAAWEKKKLRALLETFWQAEAEVKAALVTAEGWEKTRLESLLAEIDSIMDRMGHQAEQWVIGRSDVPLDSPLGSLSHFPAVAGYETAMTAVGASASFTMIHIPVLNYMQDYHLGLIRKVTQDIRNRIKEELKLGYIMGESIPTIAKRLRNTKLDKGVWPSVEKRAEVIARTEVIRASNQGALQVYRQHQVKRVIWLTAADERTCDRCGPLHKKIFPIDQLPYGGPPVHPRCRCFVVCHLVTTEEEGALADKEARKNIKEFSKKELEKKNKKDAKIKEKLSLEEAARADIKSGKYKLTVNAHKQNRHIEGTKEYNDYVIKLALRGEKPSILTVDSQALVNQYSGTGRIIVSKRNPPKEVVEANQVVGKYYDPQQNKFIESNRAMIIYSKTGTHVYPAKKGSDKT